MSDWNKPQGPFDIPDVPDFIPRRLKPWLFIFFVLVIQFSGGLYLAAVTDMVGTKALMQEDILMAGYASLIGMSINFAVMFRFKFRFSNRIQLLATGLVLLTATIICSFTESVPVLVVTCFIAGWFRMQGTLACNSTIQLWLTPVRDMAVFFCYVYLLVDGVIQLSGLTSIYIAFYSRWEYMHLLMGSLLCLMMVMVLFLVRPVRGPMYIPLKGIDWTGAFLWSIFFICFTFVCVYGNFYDWWDAVEIRVATAIGTVTLLINLWRASFLENPYISFQAMTNRNVVRAIIIYVIFFTLMATEHLFEHTYAGTVLGFDETNLIDLNWYVLWGVIAGAGFTYVTFARCKWRYKTMTAIGFALAVIYLAWFYFFIDYGIEKEQLFLPLFIRGAASVIISIVYLTSIVQSGLHFTVFPQALTINGFAGAVMGAAFCPALLGEWFRHTVARNSALLGSSITDLTPAAGNLHLPQLYGMVQVQSLIVSMKEIYGWLLIIGIISLTVILLSYGPVRPGAFFPSWKTIRHLIAAGIPRQLKVRS
ncbi:MAG: hypothetical protein K2M07_06625 [Muribaculaceae bacterium]|nr:hypothetical protein [Muribaculaceae bacterium]